MQPKKVKEAQQMGELIKLLYWHKHAMVCFFFLFCYEYPQYFIFPKEKKDELALLSGVVYQLFGQWENQIAILDALRDPD